MGNTLYLKCNAGISGDMFSGAMLDLGADSNVLRKVLESMDLPGYRLEIRKVMEKGIPATDFDVVLDEEYMAGLREKKVTRVLSDIMKIIENSIASEKVKQLAKEIFYIDAKAEAKAHGVDVEEVTFHETGAIDSIVDIMSAAVCMEDLGIDNVIITDVAEGTGRIQCRCSELNVPVPAVVNIADQYEIPLRVTDVVGEMVTPTGAAIAAAIRTKDKLPERFSILAQGAGTGKRNYPHPRVLEAFLIDEE